MNEPYMQRAVSLSERGMELGHGGPFGAVIVKDGAIYWSRIGKVYFAITRHDAAGIKFRDEFIYEELAKPLGDRKLPMIYAPCDGASDAFAAWMNMAGHTRY